VLLLYLVAHLLYFFPWHSLGISNKNLIQLFNAYKICIDPINI
jgi:hypothetical protein